LQVTKINIESAFDCVNKGIYDFSRFERKNAIGTTKRKRQL